MENFNAAVWIPPRPKATRGGTMLLKDQAPILELQDEQQRDDDTVGISMFLVSMVFFTVMLSWAAIEFYNWMHTSEELDNEKGQLQAVLSARDTKTLALAQGNIKLKAQRQDLLHWTRLNQGLDQQIGAAGKKLAAANLSREKLAKDLGLLEKKYRKKCRGFKAPYAILGCMKRGYRWTWVKVCASKKGKPDCRRREWFCKSLRALYDDNDINENEGSNDRFGKKHKVGG